MPTCLTRLLLAAAATTSLLVATAPAQASLYVGSWDPKFGTPFTGLNFNPATALKWDLEWDGAFSVNADCLPNGTIASCTGPVTVASLSVTLSRPVNPNVVSDLGAAVTMSFTPASLNIYEMTIVSDVITELQTDLSNYVTPSVSDPALAAALSGYAFAVGFVINGLAEPGSTFEEFLEDAGVRGLVPFAYSGPVLVARTGVLNYRFSDVAQYPAEFTGLKRQRDPGQSIPEPGVLALVAGALLAGGLARRRNAGR